MLSKHCTTITPGRVIYHETPIVQWTPEQITLRTGGWRTVTTKRKMNQASLQFGLGFQVFQRKFDWFVLFDGIETPFTGETMSWGR